METIRWIRYHRVSIVTVYRSSGIENFIGFKLTLINGNVILVQVVEDIYRNFGDPSEVVLLQTPTIMDNVTNVVDTHLILDPTLPASLVVPNFTLLKEVRDGNSNRDYLGVSV